MNQARQKEKDVESLQELVWAAETLQKIGEIVRRNLYFGTSTAGADLAIKTAELWVRSAVDEMRSQIK